MEFYDWLLVLDIVIVIGIRISLLMEKMDKRGKGVENGKSRYDKA